MQSFNLADEMFCKYPTADEFCFCRVDRDRGDLTNTLYFGQLYVQQHLKGCQNRFPKQKGHIGFFFNPEVDDRLKKNYYPE